MRARLSTHLFFPADNNRVFLRPFNPVCIFFLSRRASAHHPPSSCFLLGLVPQMCPGVFVVDSGPAGILVVAAGPELLTDWCVCRNVGRVRISCVIPDQNKAEQDTTSAPLRWIKSQLSTFEMMISVTLHMVCVCCLPVLTDLPPALLYSV